VRGLLIICDHGNLEGERGIAHRATPYRRSGRHDRRYAVAIHDLTDIASVVRRALGLALVREMMLRLARFFSLHLFALAWAS
jgi:hypothetical protein